MKVLARSRYGAATNCSGWARSDHQRPAADCSPRQAIPHGTRRQYPIALLQGWAKRSVPNSRVNMILAGTAQMRLCHLTNLRTLSQIRAHLGKHAAKHLGRQHAGVGVVARAMIAVVKFQGAG